jgi:hypothetical protein
VVVFCATRVRVYPETDLVVNVGFLET